MIRLTVPFAVLLLAACTEEPVGEQQPPLAKEDAQAIAALNFPQTDIEALGACVRANASPDELGAMAQGGDVAKSVTAEILQRPGTTQCIADNQIELPA